mgnify:FL=1
MGGGRRFGPPCRGAGVPSHRSNHSPRNSACSHNHVRNHRPRKHRCSHEDLHGMQGTHRRGDSRCEAWARRGGWSEDWVHFPRLEAQQEEDETGQRNVLGWKEEMTQRCLRPWRASMPRCYCGDGAHTCWWNCTFC